MEIDVDRKVLEELNALTEWHKAHCPEYKRLLELFYPEYKSAAALEDVPFIPVSLFKTRQLKSIPEKDVYKVLQSSGTTSSARSRIYLDIETARAQSSALADILTPIIGDKRLPLLVLDTPRAIARRDSDYSARAAAIGGMLNFGRSTHYALDDEMGMDLASIKAWMQKEGPGPFLLFGMTFVVWECFIKPLKKRGLDLSGSILLHTGGWKRMEEEAVSSEQFKQTVFEKTGIDRCYNFYGMVEQVGSVFVECEAGFLHTPEFASIVIRDPKTLQALPTGEKGLVEVLSILPKSYPGHALLTEDLGRICSEKCPCGHSGKAFKLFGRVERAEIRGCSDSYAFKHS